MLWIDDSAFQRAGDERGQSYLNFPFKTQTISAHLASIKSMLMESRELSSTSLCSLLFFCHQHLCLFWSFSFPTYDPLTHNLNV